MWRREPGSSSKRHHILSESYETYTSILWSKHVPIFLCLTESSFATYWNDLSRLVRHLHAEKPRLLVIRQQVEHNAGVFLRKVYINVTLLSDVSLTIRQSFYISFRTVSRWAGLDVLLRLLPRRRRLWSWQGRLWHRRSMRRGPRLWRQQLSSNESRWRVSSGCRLLRAYVVNHDEFVWACAWMCVYVCV